MKKILKRATAILVAMILTISTMVIPVGAAGQTTIKLKQGDKLSYGSGYGWTTHMLYADDTMTYCINPHKPLPSDGIYSTDNDNLYEYTSSMANYDLFRKALYYCYGGEGFRNSPYFPTDTSKHYPKYNDSNMDSFMWNIKYGPAGFENIEPSSVNLYYLLTHRVLAYINGDSEWDYGLPSAWIDAVKELVTAIKKAPMPPINTKLYILNLGSEYQNVIVQRTSIKLQLQKASSNPAISSNNSCYSLEGAKYNIYLDDKCTDYFGYIETNADGFGQYNGGADVPSQSYYAKEVTTPKGYALDKTVYKFTDTGKKADSSAVYAVSCKDAPQNDPVIILLSKLDADTRVPVSGAEFTVKYYAGFYNTETELKDKLAERSWILKTDSDGYTELNEDYLVTGDDFYYSSGENSNPVLPLGTITIQETKAPAGYELNEELFVRQVTTDGSTEHVNTFNMPTVLEKKATTGMIKIVKKASDNKNVLKNAVFGVYTSNATDTNGNLLDINKIDTVTTDADGVAISKDLEIGTYYVQEITPPSGYELKKVVYPANVQADNTIDNPIIITAYNDCEKGSLRVVKSAEDNFVEGIEFRLFGKSISGTEVDVTAKTNAEGIAVFNDVLVGNYTIEELNTANKYIVPAKQTATVEWNKQTNVDFKNILKRGSIKVVKSAEDNFVEGIEFRLFGKSISGTEVDVTTKTNADGVAEFSDVLVGNYTVEEINTKSYYIVPNQQTGLIEWKNISTVSFENLLKKGSVEIKKTSEDKLTEGFKFRLYGTSLSGAAINMIATTNADGIARFNDVLIGAYTVEEIDVPAEYVVPAKQDVTVEYDAEKNIGINSTLQFTNNLKHGTIGTTAKDKATGTNQGFVSKTTTIVDTVRYTGLIVGKEYTVKGILMDKATAKPLTVDGKEITAEKTFTAKKTDGAVDVEFNFDSTALAGKAVVAFENLYYNDIEVASHADIEDKGQTVEFTKPKVGTTAKDKATGTNQGFVSKTTTIVDTVRYTGLIVGKKYTVKGILMDKATTKPLLVDGKEITAEKTFTAETADGAIDVEFVFDSSALAGKAVVAFENLYYNDIEVATHADIEDKGQTVEFTEPKVGTTAKDKATGTNQGFVSKTTTIVDTVAYTGLIVGKEYTVKGILMDKTTTKPLLVDGKEITAEKTFTAKETDGTVAVEFVFDSSALAGKAVVAFENLYYNDIEVATHADIEDKGQTVSYVEPATVNDDNIGSDGSGDNIDTNGNGDDITTNGGTAQTGDTVPALIIALFFISAGIVSFIYIKKEQKTK